MSDIALIFDGVNGVTSDTFVRMTRQRSLAEGKQKDDEWIASFAASCLEGQALSWYESQSGDIQESWKLLRRAFLSQWPAPALGVHTPNAATVTPTPAAAPPSLRPKSLEAVKPTSSNASPLPGSIALAASIGCIRLLGKSGGHLGYLAKNPLGGPHGAYTMTSQRSSAAVIDIRSSGLTSQIRLASSNEKALGVRYTDTRTPSSLRAEFAAGRLWWSRLYALQEDVSARFGWRGGNTYNNSGFNGSGDMWLVLKNDVICPLWKASNGAIYPLEVWLINTTPGAAVVELAVTNSGEKMKQDRASQGYNNQIPIEIVFEPLSYTALYPKISIGWEPEHQ